MGIFSSAPTLDEKVGDLLKKQGLAEIVEGMDEINHLSPSHPLRKKLESAGVFNSVTKLKRFYKFLILTKLEKFIDDGNDGDDKGEEKEQTTQTEQTNETIQTDANIVNKDNPIVASHFLSDDDFLGAELSVIQWHSIYLESLLQRRFFVLSYGETPGSLERLDYVLRRIIDCKEISFVLYDKSDIITRDTISALEYIKHDATSNDFPLLLEIENKFGIAKKDKAEIEKKMKAYDERANFLKATNA